MKITFRTDLPIDTTMQFEDIFEPELRLDVTDKTDLLKNCITVWLLVDGKLAGEMYGVRHTEFDEEILDVDHSEGQYIYLYSAAILPEFEGKGLTKILMANWMGRIAGKCEAVTAHCTHPAMTHLCETFGGEFFHTHQNWFDSGREATFCKIYLS
jgi:GNAT superfamily N-acetyltransferase